MKHENLININCINLSLDVSMKRKKKRKEKKMLNDFDCTKAPSEFCELKASGYL